jgi:hypothetical protein
MFFAIVHAMTKKLLRTKLASLEAELKKLHAHQDVITQRRIDSDMGDDFRENEGAKLVMEQHDILWIRTNALRREILALRKQLLKLAS